MTALNYITLIASVLLIFLILIQTRGASLGAGLGGGEEVNTVRRGSDKTVHQITIFLVFVFAGSLILNVVV
jgi:protein translocase SecG subunit